MYLKSLELHGFKSFPEKTVLQFDKGSTVIVGPNGSGKSNITDAMRWVLGELSSKSIRGSKMEDVIFIGADGYRQMNFAEVSVTFDDSQRPKTLNSEYDEITVTRRYYRNGDSEYFINRKPVRLKDIYELFMNTGIGRDGYSIVGQGRIAEIISKKSEDRRGIFEETAGISKYRYRKHESEKKLAETESNMVRLNDILSGLESRVGPMERAAQKARKYIELFEKKKEADISLWLYDMVRMKDDADKLSAECIMSAHELEIAQDTISQLESQSDRLFGESQENKQAQSALFEEIKNLRNRIHELENSYHLLENNTVHLRSTIETEKSLADKAREDAKAEDDSIAGLKIKLQQIKSESVDTAGEIADTRDAGNKLNTQKAETEKQIADAFEEIKGLEAQKNDISVRINVLKNTLSQNTERTKAINSDITKYEAELEDKRSQIEKINGSVASYADTADKANEALATADKRLNDKSDEIEREKQTITQITSEKSALESRISALSRMLEHFDGYNNSVRYVMNESKKGTLRGIRGPISYLIHVPEEYTVAIETALGSGLQYIVVDDEEIAKAAINSLKHSGSGRATFYPISSVRGRQRSRELNEAAFAKGFLGYADEIIETEQTYREIMSSLLGSYAVFDNIENATSAAKASSWKIRAVTLDGQQINAGGSFTGGSVRRDSGILTRQTQIDKMNGDLENVNNRLSTANVRLAKSRTEYEKLRSEKTQTEEKLKIVESLKRSELLEADELGARCDVLDKLLVQLREDIEKIGREENEGNTNSAILSEKLEELSALILDKTAARYDLDAKRHDIDADISANASDLSALLVKEAEQNKDIENTENEIAASEERKAAYTLSAEEHDKKVTEAEASVAEDAKKIESMRSEVQTDTSDLEKKENEYTGLEQGGFDFEKRINELNRRIRDLSSKKELQLEAHTRNQNKLDNLNSDIEKMNTRIFDEYELTHTEAISLGYTGVTKENRPAVVSTLNEMKAQIKALGSVNVDAIEEYAELKQEYDHLKQQMEDLTKSKDELSSIISSIDTEMERLFRDAFEKINKNFGEVFRELFGGGHAELSLTDPDDVLNCGIEISAAPPGKMIKNLSLLSGGEQAFIAIALMFALIKVNPSPFCIFDEIEAALDEVNVNRVANYISRFSKDIQIIMITHRRGTMEIADTLYGVTMPRHGISKVFTLDVTSVAKQQFMDENMK